MNMEEIWKKTLAQIEVKLDSPAQFKTWFQDTRLKTIIKKEAIIQVKNPYTADWLKNRHQAMIKDTLSFVAGKPVQIKFEVNGSLINDDAAIEDEPTSTKTTAATQPPTLGMQNTLEQDFNKVIEASGLNPKYKINKYIVGNSNKMAHAAAVAVIEQPGTTYNPFFVYGPSGVGKTHLAQSIGIGIIEKNPNRKVIYSPAEGFLNDMVKGIREGKNLEFRRKFRKIDCLIIDDIQFLSRWEMTQDEMFNTFNELYNADKQIILVSDRKPEEIKNIDTRLRTRFMGGITVDISAPDFAMRIAVLEQKMRLRGIQLPQQTVEFLAKSITTNIRELEGAVQKLSLYANLKPDGEALTNQEIASIVGIDAKSKRKKLTNYQILKIVAKEFDVTAADIKGKRRTADIALARQVAMYVLREELEYKLEEIAEIINRKDHTTVMHGIDKIKSMIAKSEGFGEQVVRIMDKIRNPE